MEGTGETTTGGQPTDGVRRILIVEDRPVARKLLQDELADVPHLEVVGQATNGKEAVDAVRRDPPDLVVMDVVMPVMDGITATREIRKFSDVPIVILSGSHQDAETLRLMADKAGANAFLLKPSGPVSVDLYAIKDELVATIEAHLR